MTIEKGEDWGGRGRLPAGGPVVDSDADLAARWSAGVPDLIVGLTSGDLHRTVGGRGSAEQLRSEERTVLPIDVGVLTLPDGSHLPFVAHVLRRRRFWAGTTLAIMNASFLGEWNVAPRGHPNDGRLDVVEASLSFSDRRKALSRLPSGAHVPHPNISIRRLKRGTFAVASGDRLIVDGEAVDTSGTIEWSVVSDALSIAI